MYLIPMIPHLLLPRSTVPFPFLEPFKPCPAFIFCTNYPESNLPHFVHSLSISPNAWVIMLPPKVLVINKTGSGDRIRLVTTQSMDASFLSNLSTVRCVKYILTNTEICIFFTLKIYYVHFHFLSLFSVAKQREKYVSFSSWALVTLFIGWHLINS